MASATEVVPDVPLKKSKKSRKEKGTSDDNTKEKKRKHVQDGDTLATEQPKAKKSKKEKKDKSAEQDVQPVEQTVELNEPLSTKKKRKTKEEIPNEDGSEKKKKRRETEQEAPVDSDRKKDKKHKRKHQGVVEETIVQVEPVLETNSLSKPSGAKPSSEDIEAFLSKHSITIHASKSGGQVIPILAFDQLDISSELRPAFKGFTEPTPIQACSWPPALQGQDVVGIAETGSGKTLAFGIPALSQLISNSSSQKAKHIGIQILVMAPTRELAIQTHETLSALGEPFGITSVAVFGGVDKGGQIRSLKDKKAKIVVGTPGRIMDLVNDGVCDLSRVSYLVLDEADRMLDKGFENDIRTFIGYAKQGEDRQTLMFSATWPDSVRKLAGSFQRDPVRVTVGSDDLTANSRVEQSVEVFDDPRSKDSRLLGHLRDLMPQTSKLPSLDDARVLVFVLYKKEATRVEGLLERQRYAVAGLHGDMSQAARMEALESFKTGKTRVLVATDVAARGLDIPNVAVVLNYSFPLTIEDYIHRIGRTGRGGKSGKSMTFFTGSDHERALAGELARVLRESGFDYEPLKKFPMTIKKKSHSVYGAFYRDDVPTPTGPTKIKF